MIIRKLFDNLNNLYNVKLNLIDFYNLLTIYYPIF